MEKLEEYQTKKAALEVELETVNRDIILTEQSVEQQQQVFQQQFGTVDVPELEKIAQGYQASIDAKEAELIALENV